MNRIPSKTTKTPQPGELWEFPLDPSELTGWVVIKRHPDQEDLLLVAPCDLQEAVGPRDLAVPTSSEDGGHGRLVLRGDWTRWTKGEDFWFRAGEQLVPRDWRREFLGRIQEGFGEARNPGVNAVREESLDWADHRDWIRDVLTVADGDIERWEKRESVWEGLAGSAPVVEHEPENTQLAADGWSAMDAAFGGEDEADLLGSDGEEEYVSELFNLFVTKAAAGRETRTYLHLTGTSAYFEIDAELAPRNAFVLGANGGRSFLRWTRTLSRKWRSQELPVVGNSLRIVVAGEPVVDVEIGLES